MKEKKYIYVLLLIVALFTIFNFVVWNVTTAKFFPEKNSIYVGDLGRISYLENSLTLRENIINLSNKHISYEDNISQVDVLTIGDSFSNGGPKGLNPYYQDYIATEQNLSVVNIQPSAQGFIETVLLLQKSGILDKINPKIILIESVERSSISRLSKNINWDISMSKGKMSFLYKKYNHSTPPKPSFINRLNYNALLYPLLYKYDDNAILSQVYIAYLNKSLFSCIDKNKLLFYYEDLKNLSQSNNKSMALLNANLNHLQEILKSKHIQLYFMPSVDKYNLYSKFINNNPYQKSNFFELLRPLKKEYNFIDTKMILEKMLDGNVSDLYYSDDTHWSYKASQEIFNQVKLK